MEAILEMSALAKASHGRARRALALADAIQDVLHSPPGNCLTSFPLQSWPQAAAKVLRTDCLQASKFLEHALGVPAADRKTSDFYQAICGAPMQAAAKLWTSMFVAILLVGLVYVWVKGDLEWIRAIRGDPRGARDVSSAVKAPNDKADDGVDEAA